MNARPTQWPSVPALALFLALATLIPSPHQAHAQERPKEEVFPDVIVLDLGRLSRPEDSVKLTLRLIDASTEKPVAGATVRVIDPFERENEATSNSLGIATLTQDLELGEVVNSMRAGSLLKVAGWRVEITAPGYRPHFAPLFEYTGHTVDTAGPRVFQKSTPLHRPQSTNTRMPTCEKYTYNEGFTVYTLILYGDKYWAVKSVPKLCSEHTPWFEAYHGQAVPDGEKLFLRVDGQERITRADSAVYEWFLNHFVRVSWSERRYLIAEEQALAFCNAVNQGDEPADSEYGDFYLHADHHKIAVTGLPDVPEAWRDYLFKTPVQGTVTELLPDHKARINIGRNAGLRAGMELLPTEEYLFSDQIVVSVEGDSAIIQTKYPNGRYRKITTGDRVSSQTPKRVTIVNPKAQQEDQETFR